MADEADEGLAGRAGGGNADPAAAIALGQGGRLDPRAAAYLEKQSRLSDEQLTLTAEQIALTRLQAEDLRREDRIRHWSLRVRHVSDVMKLAFEVSAAIILVAIVVFLGAAIWSAANDNSLIIDAFNVPREMADRGLTGQVVAAQLQDKLAAMQNGTDSARPEASYANNWGDDIKVEIPNTGISIGEFYRYLAKWLGHQTHITGEVYRTASEEIAVTARTGDNGATVTGAEADLDKLMQRVAEKIYARTQPYRYAIFLGNDPARIAEQVALLNQLAADGSRLDRIWAHIGLSTIMSIQTDPLNAPAEQAKDLELAPDLSLVYQNLAQYEQVLDHQEAALAYQRRATERFQVDDGQISERARRISVPNSQALVAEHLGDYLTALRFNGEAAGMADYSLIKEFVVEGTKFDHAALHEWTAARPIFARRVAEGGPGFAAALDQIDLTAANASRDWPQVLTLGKSLEAEVRALRSLPGYTDTFVETIVSREVWPFVARAMAETGDIAGAQALIARTPPDCYTCALNRANIAAVAKDWPAADAWYARTIHDAPSIPFAYADWGRALMAKGDLDGAIAKFEMANDKGPHWADPLELWGEVLLAQRHPDDAAEKFEQANEFAPRWGRLHLKWGEALAANGDRDGAVRQFTTAATLDLDGAERAELARAKAALPSPR